MIEELIVRIFKARNQAHMRHWKTDSYSEHKALGHYYEGIIDKLDQIVETYQGGFGLVEKLPDEIEDAKELVKDEMLWLTKNREKIAKEIPALENLLDDLTGLHMRTLYKLENLR
tara:strand:- start:262 stop:606 length:345 start_codon:yes stop_codon:yes gene_type:complete